MPLSESWIPVSIILLSAWLGVVLTLITLPGTWLALLGGIAVCWWKPELLSPWTVVAVGVLAIIAEVLEFLASALGATRGGSTRKGAMGALVGSIIGAIAGAPFLLPLGSILGGVVGAGVGALIVERGVAGRTWRQSAAAGHGAATGRLVATIAKGAIALVMAIILTLAVFIRGF